MALHRYPVRPDVYEKHKDQLVVKGNPFNEHSEFQINAQENQAYTRLLPHLVEAVRGSNPYDLQKAWRRTAASGEKSRELALLRQPPFDQAKALEYADLCASNPAKVAGLVAEWSELFSRRYREVLGEGTR
ncbi:MAG TPA: hypothetical protein VLM89_09790 [Phycisphaerae bacterium]|nr:hypothetical protein [Phycisphaerae bacterium]